MATPTKITRVLVLHGYSQNASVFSKRLGALRKQCGKGVEFYFLDAPIVLQPEDLEGFSSNPQGTLEALGSSTDPSVIPRGWFRVNKERTQAFGLEDTLLHIRDLLVKEKFDGIFGFSQGACIAALLAALLERPDVYPPFLVDGQAPHPPFEFCIAAAGFKLTFPLGEQIFGDSYATPTLHIIGLADTIVSPERSRTLVEISQKKRVEEHDGGHFVPSKANWRRFLKEYLTNPTGDVASPGTHLLDTPMASAPGSGASTPFTAEANGGSAA
ncbi:hypothetical protein HGRIS_001915 [Hohenbuehelia grisea]|uniref:Serine hydrolase domain-containing protein n=1 Tax=Hohenbuehelia grisea TaxID=104357 RepID=A0ABR3JKM6_9AGAR